MTLVKIGTQHVDVVNEDCAFRPCFTLGFDKGTFVQGRGYTSYRKTALPVCWTRHLSGCPHADGHLLDPTLCCAEPEVARVRGAMRQRCRSCGTWLRGERLRLVQERSQ